MLKRDSVWLGALLGLIAPIFGMWLFKVYKFGIFTLQETAKFMMVEPGHKTLTVALSLSLLINALFFTIYINTSRDKTAKGLFITTVLYGLLILSIKTFS